MKGHIIITTIVLLSVLLIYHFEIFFFAFIGSLPIFCAFYFLHKKRNINILLPIFLPLIAALVVPGLMILIAFRTGNEWVGLGGAVVALLNTILYTLNEIYWFLYNRKLHKSS